MRPKSKASTTQPASDFPEFLVRHDSFDRYFDRPLPTSTFHDLIKKGKIIPMKSMRGFFYLNQSLRRLGLREVRELPTPQSSPSMKELTELAFTMIDPLLFPAPQWLMKEEGIDLKDYDHAKLLAEKHREIVEAYEDVPLKIAYYHGALDAAVIMESVPEDSRDDEEKEDAATNYALNALLQPSFS